MNIWLPHLREDPRIGKIGKKELDQLTMNILKLQCYKGSDERIDYILELYEEYQVELRSTADIPLGQGSSLLKQAIDLDLSATTVKDYHVPEMVNSRDAREIFLFSDSHTSTFRSLQDSENGFTRAIVCFDTHDDLSDMEKPWKGNVFTHLLNTGIVDYLVLVGVADFRIRKTLARISSELSRQVLFSTNPTVIIAWLKAKQVDEAYLSFDLDVIRTRTEQLTAMEYCPFGVLLNVSSSSLGQLGFVEAQNFAEGCIRPPVGTKGVRNLYHLGEEGPTTDDALKLIKEIKRLMTISGISKGFKANWGTLLGDVVELNGPDLGYRTSTFSLLVCQTWREGIS